jgi:hypothetical protein
VSQLRRQLLSSHTSRGSTSLTAVYSELRCKLVRRLQLLSKTSQKFFKGPLIAFASFRCMMLLYFCVRLSAHQVDAILQCSPYHGHPALTAFNDLLRMGASLITNSKFSDIQWTQACLSIRDGGLVFVVLLRSHFQPFWLLRRARLAPRLPSLEVMSSFLLQSRNSSSNLVQSV